MNYDPMQYATARAGVVGQTAAGIQTAVVDAASKISEIVKQKNIDEKIEVMYANELKNFADEAYEIDPSKSKASYTIQARKIYKPPMKELGAENNIKMLLSGDIPRQKYMDKLRTETEATGFIKKTGQPISGTRQIQAEGPPVQQGERVGEVPMEEQITQRPMRGAEYEKGFEGLTPEAREMVPESVGERVKSTEEIYREPMKIYKEQREQEKEDRNTKIKTMGGLDAAAGFNTGIVESQKSEANLNTKLKTTEELIKSVAKAEGMSPRQIGEGKQNTLNLEIEQIAEELGVPAQLANDTEFLGRMKTDLEQLIKNEKIEQDSLKKSKEALESKEQQELDIKRIKASKTGGSELETAFSKKYGISSQDAIAAIELAKEVGGTRKWKEVLPDIALELSAGKSIDQIRDEKRYATQSEDFSGVLRASIQKLYIGRPSTIRTDDFEYFDDAITRGDKKALKGLFKTAAIKATTAAHGERIVEKGRTIEFLNEIKADLKAFEDAGGNTGIFAGTKEKVANAIGRTTDKRLAALATKIQGAIQAYRHSTTGVAFNLLEGKEYNGMFPSISKTSKLNSALLDALITRFEGDTDYYYRRKIGEDAWNLLNSPGDSLTPPQAEVPAGGVVAPAAQQITPQIRARAEEALNDPEATPEEKEQARLILGQ